MLRTAAPDAAVFHSGGLPNFLARTVLRTDLARRPELVPASERPPAALLTTELVCAIAYGSAYTVFVDVSREPTVLFPDRFTPRPGATRRVLHIGDSMVFGANVPHDQTFAADLEKLEPDTQHINGGISGMAPDEYLVVLRSWLARQPVDLAVMYLFEETTLMASICRIPVLIVNRSWPTKAVRQSCATRPSRRTTKEPDCNGSWSTARCRTSGGS
jgi:hypothetical protein